MFLSNIGQVKKKPAVTRAQLLHGFRPL